MIEQDVESRLVKKVKKLGGIAYKFESSGNNGVPDRIVVLPGNRIYFIEVKNKGKKPRKLQVFKMKELANMGCNVRCLDTFEKVDSFIEEVSK